MNEQEIIAANAAVIRRMYHVDPSTLTLPQFLDLLNQLPKREGEGARDWFDRNVVPGTVRNHV